MRLIDADALIEAIEDIKLYNVTPPNPPYDMNRVRADELIETINAQPTAYDVEAVVAELEELKEHGVRCKDCAFREEVDCFDLCEKGAIIRAIEIVRNGGKE